MIRLHATLQSINAYKVRLLLAILDIPFELVELVIRQIAPHLLDFSFELLPVSFHLLGLR